MDTCYSKSKYQLKLNRLERNISSEMIKFAALLTVFALVYGVSAEDFAPDCGDEFFKVIANPQDCSQFFVCMKGVPVRFFCDDDTIFSVRRSRCVPGDQASCGDLELPEDACLDTFFRILQHPSNCGKFFVCMAGSPVMFECDEGQIFSEEHRRCVPGDRAYCDINTTL